MLHLNYLLIFELVDNDFKLFNIVVDVEFKLLTDNVELLEDNVELL